MQGSDTMVGVRDTSKVVASHHPASQEKKMKTTKLDERATKVSEAVSKVRAEVDKLSDKVVVLERNVRGGTKSEDLEFVVLIELFMMQLLKLDEIEADGEAKLQRKTEVCRVQSFVDTLDYLRARNSDMFSNATLAKAKQELLLTGAPSLRQSVPPKPSTIATQQWELFD